MEEYMNQEIKEFKKAFIYICLIGIFTHMYILTNKLLNFDEILNLFSKGATLELGRWGLELTKYIFPNYSMPVFNGMLSIFLISLSDKTLICSIFFNFKRVFFSILET